MAFSDYKIGTTQVGMVTLSSLGVPPPKTNAVGGERAMLADGMERAIGWPYITWYWNALARTARDALRAYCTGTSAKVYIKTPTNNSADAFGEFYVVMVWPVEEIKAHTSYARREFTLVFRILENVTP